MHAWFTTARKVRLIAAIVIALMSFATFMLASMAGPNQLHFLLITALCDAGLVVLAVI